MGLSWAHILVVAVIALLLFGRGKVSELMGDVAQGIKSFKKGLADDTAAAEPRVLDHDAARAAETRTGARDTPGRV